MCPRCLTLDLRATALKELAVLRDDRAICERLRRLIDAEIDERRNALDLDDSSDEKL
jgi:hypothetical protein